MRAASPALLRASVNAELEARGFAVTVSRVEAAQPVKRVRPVSEWNDAEASPPPPATTADDSPSSEGSTAGIIGALVGAGFVGLAGLLYVWRDRMTCTRTSLQP